MTAIVQTETFRISSKPGGPHLVYEGEYNGYQAQCITCDWRGDLHAIGLESAPNWAAIRDADSHNESVHS